MNTAYGNLVDLLGDPNESVSTISGGRKYIWRNGDGDELWLEVRRHGLEHRVQVIWPRVDSYLNLRIDGLNDIQKRAAILSIVCILVPSPHEEGAS